MRNLVLLLKRAFGRAAEEAPTGVPDCVIGQSADQDAFSDPGVDGEPASVQGSKADKMQRLRELREAQLREREQREAEFSRKQAVEERNRLESAMLIAGREATRAYNEIPDLILCAEKHLNKADAEFHANAYAPFWDAVEKALPFFGEVTSRTRDITEAGTRHKRAAKAYKKKAIASAGWLLPTFPVASSDAIRYGKVAESARIRLAEIVRRGQTNFYFAAIYEQRRTNAILIEGFQTLSDAIEHLGDRLNFSLAGLSNQLARLEDGQRARHAELVQSVQEVSASNRDIVSAVQLSGQDTVLAIEIAGHEAASAQIEASELMTDTLRSIGEEARDQRAKIAFHQTAQAERQLAILDNLQRNRRPLPQERGPRYF